MWGRNPGCCVVVVVVVATIGLIFGVVRCKQYDSLPVAELKSQKFAQLANKGETSQAAFLQMP